MQSAILTDEENSNGDSLVDLIAKSSNDEWWLAKNTGGQFSEPVKPVIDGMLDAYETTDIFYAGDYSGDGIGDIMIRRPSTRVLYVNKHVADIPFN